VATRGGGLLGGGGSGASTLARPVTTAAIMSLAVLVGVLALRMAVIWSAQ
jgi:hypothetical protein